MDSPTVSLLVLAGPLGASGTPCPLAEVAVADPFPESAMDIVVRGIGDDLGPEKVLLVREPRARLDAIVVVDNVACGPAIGGVRMAPDVTVDEVFRLARAMTFKNAAAGLPHGGGKAGIVADPGAPEARREDLVRAFARAIADLREYIPGPDMGTDEV